MGHILKRTSLEKHIAKQEKAIAKAEIKISQIESSVRGTAKGRAKKIRTQEAIISSALKEKNAYGRISDVVNKVSSGAATTVSTGVNEKIEKNSR